MVINYEKQKKIDIIKKCSKINITELALKINVKSPSNLYKGKYTVKKYNKILKEILKITSEISKEIIEELENYSEYEK